MVIPHLLRGKAIAHPMHGDFESTKLLKFGGLVNCSRPVCAGGAIKIVQCCKAIGKCLDSLE